MLLNKMSVDVAKMTILAHIYCSMVRVLLEVSLLNEMHSEDGSPLPNFAPNWIFL